MTLTVGVETADVGGHLGAILVTGQTDAKRGDHTAQLGGGTLQIHFDELTGHMLGPSLLNFF